MTVQRKPGPLTFLTGVLQRQEDTGFRHLAEQLSDAVFLVVPRTGLFRYFNHRAADMTGYSREELDRQSLSEWLSSPGAAEALDLIHKLEIGVQRIIPNVPLKIKSGKLVYADLRVSATLSEGEVLALIIARDTGQRMMLEQAWNDHQHSLAALSELTTLLASPDQESSQQLLALCQRFLHANIVILYHHAEEYLGYRLYEAINLPREFPSSIGGIDPATAGAALNWRAGERPTSLLSRAARFAGLSALYVRPVGTGAAPSAIFAVGYLSLPTPALDPTALIDTAVNIIGTAQAIRQQIAAQDERIKNASDVTRRFNILSTETDEGMVRIDAAGRIVELNPAAESLLGYSLEDTADLPLDDLLISPQPLAQPLLAALQSGKRWGGVEADLIRRDGASVAVFVRAIPLADGPSSQGGLILISDRTDQRQFQAQSDHLERRAWLGDLSAIFAHDVRNPLNGIATGLSYLSGKFDPSDPLADAIGKMQAEVNRIEQLLKNVLLVAKSAQLDYKPVPLHQLLERTLGRWGNRLARRSIQLVHDIDPRTPLATADTHQMDQVFTNLIVNAYDAMSEKGGTLSVKCHAATHPKAPRGEFVELLFGDTGPGIPPELQPRIFDPFITTKSDGTGLGLAITKRIVTAHKGTIFAESWPGIGAAFHVFIPVARPHTDL